MGKAIYVVVGDIGGANEVVSAVKELEKRGHTVSYFLDPSPKAKAWSVLDTAGVKYEKRGPVAEDAPSVIVIGTSATACGTQVEFTKFGKGKNIPVIWVEDLYGTGERKTVQGVAPDAMCVIDAVAEQIAKNVRAGLKTHIVGKPSFETLPQLIARKTEVRASVRGKLSVAENDVFVPWLFGGDPPERSWAQLKQFAERTAGSSRNEIFGLRFHPKHPDFEAQMKFVSSLSVKTVDTRLIKDAKELMLSADLVFADWGNTDAVTALLARVPVATILFPGDTQRLLDAGYPRGVPPIIVGYQEYGMRSVADMEDVLADIGRTASSLSKDTIARAKNFEQLLAPGAAGRIADVIKKYLA